MSLETMYAHNEALEEAAEIVKRYLLPEGSCGEENCEICLYAKRHRLRILAALKRARV